MRLLGDWDVTINTPIGSLAADYSFTDTDDGLSGHSRAGKLPRSTVVGQRRR